VGGGVDEGSSRVRRNSKESTTEFFDQLYRLQTHDTSIPVEEQFAGANARIPSDVDSILDVGCGRGGFLRWLPDAYRKVGLDFSCAALAEVGCPRILGSVDSLPLASSSFDLVSCFELLEHLPHRIFPKALQELGRVSRKYIMISVPNREVLREGLVWCPRCSCAFNASWHMRSFDEAVLGRLFTGFRMVECRPCGPLARYGTSGLGSLALLLARRRPPAAVLCPLCGYSEADPSDGRGGTGPASGGRTTLGRIARAIAHRALFRARRPYWLLALYARAPGGAART
jgi:hypothetical protein